MKIYILPYAFKHSVFFNKRVSGVDESMLKQFHVLKELGHDVRMFVPFGDLHEHLDGVDHYGPDPVDAKNNQKIHQKMLNAISDFQPDVILSNISFVASMYRKLLVLDIPILYYSCAVPGFFSDLTSGALLSEFVKNGHSIACTSKYHANRFFIYYNRERKGWEFEKNISVDHVLHPSYIEKPIKVIPSDGKIRHVSAANKEKDTFLIHKVFENTEIESEVFTTINYVGGKLSDYVKENIEKYKAAPRNTKFDIDHAEILKSMAQSTAAFVGLASYDSFTITSLEALAHGVPLILKGYKGHHPAKEMVEPEFQKYIRVYGKARDSIDIFNDYSKMSIEDRQALADSAYKVLNKDIFGQNLENALYKTIEKKKQTLSQSSNLNEFFVA